MFRFHQNIIIGILISIWPGFASAQGVFDFLDPCIAAKDDYWEAREEIITQIDTRVGNIDTEPANTEFIVWWWSEKEKVLRKAFDDMFSDVVKDSGGDVEVAYKNWLTKIIEEAGGAEKIKEDVIDIEYRRVRTIKAQQEAGAVVEELDKTKNDLYDSCPEDVANQVFRGTIAIVAAPIGWVSENFKSAKEESGAISQATKAVLGISADDIAKQGVLGGDNSEARKAANAVAGGKNSEVRKTLRALDPSGWW